VNRRAKHLFALAAALMLAGTLALRSTRTSNTEEAPAPSATTASAAAPALRDSARRLGLRVDTTYTYALEYESENRTASLPGLGTTGGGASGILHLVGKLALHAFPSDEGLLVGWSMPEVATALLRVLDQDLWKGKADADATFANAEMFVDADSSGRPRLLRSRAFDGGLFDHVMQLLVQDLSIELGTGTLWTALEASPHGVARSTYKAGTDDAGALVSLSRQRDTFTLLRAAAALDHEPSVAIDSRHDGLFAPDGYVDTWSGTESLIVRARGAAGDPLVRATTKLSMRLVSIAHEQRPRPSLDGLATRTVYEPAQAKANRRAILEARVAGLTVEEALATLDQLSGLDRLSDHEQFLWRVVALVELNPAFCDALGALFERSDRGGRTQAVILDVLANAGTEKSQATMRALLDKRDAKQHESFASLVQRFSMVDRPTPETGRWVANQFRDATREKNRDKRLASAYALGSVADRLRSSGDGAEARKHTDELRDAMKHAEDDMILAYLVTALANTDAPELGQWLGGYASHPSADVRASVAAALDEPPTPEATRILLELAGDPNKLVQSQAIRALRRHTLSAANLRLLAGYASAGRFHPTNLRALLDMIKPSRMTEPVATRELLAALLAAGVDDAEVRAAVVLLLG
jgi:hypothetical protein